MTMALPTVTRHLAKLRRVEHAAARETMTTEDGRRLKRDGDT